jgi:Lipocalin-like domain
MGAIGQQNCTGPQLGTWKLQSFTTEDLATRQKTDLFGAHPSGYLSYGPDCRMSAILVKEGRKAPNSFVPTDAERVDLYSGFIAYADERGDHSPPDHRAPANPTL